MAARKQGDFFPISNPGERANRSARSVLVLRPDNLGDVVLFSGALRHLRAHFPHAEITLVVKRYAAGLFDRCPHVDQVLPWEEFQRTPLDALPGFRGRDRLAALVRRARTFVRHHADVVLLPVRSPGPLQHAVARAVRASERYAVSGDLSNQSPGDARRAEQSYTGCLRLAEESEELHEMEVTRAFLELLGRRASLEDLWPEFWTDEADRRWAAEAIPLEPNRLALAICPGVTSLRGKFYAGENYAAALDQLPRHRFNVVLLGSAAERSMCEEVGRAVRACRNVGTVTNLAGQSTVRQLVEGLRRCHVVLAQETAALHIATALRRPTVGILGGGHFGRFYPWGTPQLNRVAHLPMECFGCNWQCRYDRIRCIQEIPPDTVARELDRALAFAGEPDPDTPPELTNACP